MSKSLVALVWTVLGLMLIGSVVAQTKKPSGTDHHVDDQTAPGNVAPGQTGSIRGRLVAEGSRPVADASVLAFPLNIAANPQGAMSSLLRPATSDADGRFSLPGLKPGAYTLAASAPGYVLSDADAREFYRAGDNVTITLSKGAVITGKVTNSVGDPLVGAIVRAIKCARLITSLCGLGPVLFRD